VEEKLSAGNARLAPWALDPNAGVEDAGGPGRGWGGEWGRHGGVGRAGVVHPAFARATDDDSGTKPANAGSGVEAVAEGPGVGVARGAYFSLPKHRAVGIDPRISAIEGLVSSDAIPVQSRHWNGGIVLARARLPTAGAAASARPARVSGRLRRAGRRRRRRGCGPS
jgi:hypothetical protein